MLKIRDERTIHIPIMFSSRSGSKPNDFSKYTFKVNGVQVSPVLTEQGNNYPDAYIVAKPSDQLTVKGSEEDEVYYTCGLCYRWAYEDLEVDGEITVRSSISEAEISARAGDVMLIELSLAE